MYGTQQELLFCGKPQITVVPPRGETRHGDLSLALAGNAVAQNATIGRHCVTLEH
jgi:hypothetical protein